MRKPQHLIRRGHTWFFRKAAPAALRPLVGKTAIIKTLGTRDYGEALRRLPLAAAEAEAALAQARRRLWECPAATMDDHGMKQSVLSWFWRARRLYRRHSKTKVRPSLRAVAAGLAESGHLSPSGRHYGPESVKRMLARGAVQRRRAT